MNINKKHNSWVLDWRHAGHRHRKFFPTQAQARRALQRIKAQREARHPRAARTGQLHQLAAQWTATKAGTTPTHQRHLHNVMRRLLEQVPPNVAPERLQAQHFITHRNSLLPLKVNTRIHHAKTVRTFIRWLYRTGNLNATPDEVYPPIHLKHERRETTIDNTTAADILRAAKRPAVLQLLLALGREAGMRIGEIANAQAQDWNRNTREIAIRSSKNHPTRINPATPALAAYLDTLIPARTPPSLPLSALVSPHGKPLRDAGLRYHWNQARKAAHATHVNPHDLRRTWATEHAEFAPLPVLMELAGWSHPHTAMHYIMKRGQEAKRAAVARAWNARQHPHTDTLESHKSGETPPHEKERIN